MNKLIASAQLYTARDLAQKDLPGLLKKVRSIGFTAVELAGYGSLSTASEAKTALDAAGLRASGSHVGLGDLTGDTGKLVADQMTLGNRNVILPWVDASKRKTVTDWIALAETLTAAGRKLDKEGLRLSYHNHAFEFDLFDGQTGMNLLLQHTDPDAVGFEVDVYWVAHAGHDPVQFLQSLGSRLRLVHLKDRAADGKFAAVGTGTLDFAAITKAAEAAGVEWGVVEQDDCYGQDPLAVLKTGYDTLKTLGCG